MNLRFNYNTHKGTSRVARYIYLTLADRAIFESILREHHHNFSEDILDGENVLGGESFGEVVWEKNVRKTILDFSPTVLDQSS